MRETQNCELIEVRENQFTGIHLNWDLVECPKEWIPVPPGSYYQVDDVLTVALDLGDGRFAPSSKHGYAEVVDTETSDTLRGQCGKCRLVGDRTPGQRKCPHCDAEWGFTPVR